MSLGLDELEDETRSPLPLAVAAAVAVVLALLVQTGAGGAVLRALGLAQNPLPYTELAFVTPRELPERVVTGQAPKNAAFEIRNMTGAEQRYTWKAYVVLGAKETEVGGAAVTVADGARVEIAPPKVRCAPGPIRFVIKLAKRDESLAFHAECGAA
ncbi:hypothetical protein LO762_13185 [Actinocorallia sp. API 0066]|uniref:hypothetical protein n=1 Tax=Actinocorallia sp. API 0066 TaxID=2896846 RepID=UPI001E58C1F2|nr:hypothetical protein [Actinocorallia sp. API 0066]MCD0450139.1 hypothetical protein [Actinocorallia sp. API 0066]